MGSAKDPGCRRGDRHRRAKRRACPNARSSAHWRHAPDRGSEPGGELGTIDKAQSSARLIGRVFRIQGDPIADYVTPFSCLIDVGSPDKAARALALFQELRAAGQNAEDPEAAGFDLLRQDAPEGSTL